MLGQVEYMKTEYEHHTEVLKRFCAEVPDVMVLLLKGLGLSYYYPKPNHRPVGDIDIYTYGQHNQIDAYFESCGLKPEQTVEKHTVVTLDGVTFENHSIYVDAYATRAEKKVQAYLETIIDDDMMTDGYYVPSPLKNYFFLLCHMARHFSEYPSITLRHLLDWGLFIIGEKEALRLQRSLIHDKLKEFGLLKCNDTFTALAQDVTGCDLSDFIFREVRQEDKERILANVFNSKSTSAPVGFIPRMCYKINLLLGNWWKYKYLAFSFWERIWFSVKLHIEHAEKI